MPRLYYANHPLPAPLEQFEQLENLAYVDYVTTTCGSNCGIKVLSNIRIYRGDPGMPYKELFTNFFEDIKLLNASKGLDASGNGMFNLPWKEFRRNAAETMLWASKEDILTKIANSVGDEYSQKLLPLRCVAVYQLKDEREGRDYMHYQVTRFEQLPFISKLVLTDVLKEDIYKFEHVPQGLSKYTGIFAEHMGLERVGKPIRNRNSSNVVQMWEWNL